MNFNRKEFITMIKESITVPEIYSRYRSTVALSGMKNYVQVECPNCRKKAFTLYRNNCKCFSCEKTGNLDVFSLYQLLNNTNDFNEALFTIAYDFGFIDKETYDNLYFLKRKKNDSQPFRVNIKNIEQKKRELEERESKCPTANLASKEVIDRVLRAVKKISPITDEQRLALEKGRNLSEDRVDSDYFNMPNPNSDFYNKLFNMLENEFGYKPTDLIGVPGFYSYDKKHVQFVKRKGIGILISGADNIATGFQVRAYDKIDSNGSMILYDRFDKNGQKRDIPKYFWCSSAGKPNGCSAGSPVDVLMPEDKENMFRTCFITEGKFKIETIVKTFNSPAISVQGVGNWVGKVEPEIKFINKNFKEIRHIYTSYDADLAFNFKIFNQCKKMIENELKDFKIAPSIVVWDYRLGKGLDDMILNGYKDKVKAINFYVFSDLFEKYMDKIRKIYPNTIETKILDNNGEKVDEAEIYKIYKKMVLEPLQIYYL